MENTPLIAVTVSIVARDFLSLAHELSSNNHFAEQVPAIAIEDELSRFKVWAGNVAAHRRGRRSLEYRLRDAERLRLEVHNSLKELDEVIHDSIAIVKGDKVPWEMEQLDSDSDTDSEPSDTSTDSGDDTELKQLLSSIKTSITGLFRLSMAIRNPAPTSQIESSITVDKSVYQEFDVLHVQAKFPDCADFLAERLGRAISARRQYLTYREEHHKKLAKDVEKIGLEDSKTEHTTNSTEATPIPAIERQNSLNVLAEDDSASQTSFATSINAAIRIPSLPKQARDQDYFECPLCFMIISVHTKHAWKQHVYRDLHPYCCTFEYCTTAGRLFDSRHEWFNHELAHHRTWECIEECGRTFWDLQEFERHIHKKHDDLIALLPAMRSTSARGASLSNPTECTLCKRQMTLKGLQKHLASHQQQLALFALPPNLDETEDDDEEEETSITDAGNHEDDDDSYASDTEDVEDLTRIDVPNDQFLAIESATRRLSIVVPSYLALQEPERRAKLREAGKLTEDLRNQIHELYFKTDLRKLEAMKGTPLWTRVTTVVSQLDNALNLIWETIPEGTGNQEETQTETQIETQIGKQSNQDSNQDDRASTNADIVQDPEIHEAQEHGAKNEGRLAQPLEQVDGKVTNSGRKPSGDWVDDNPDTSNSQQQHSTDRPGLDGGLLHTEGDEIRGTTSRAITDWGLLSDEDRPFPPDIGLDRQGNDDDHRILSKDESDISFQSVELDQQVNEKNIEVYARSLAQQHRVALNDTASPQLMSPGDDPLVTDPQNNVDNNPISEWRSEPTDEPTRTSSAFSMSANPDEDWHKISDEAERRRIRDRFVQHHYHDQLKKGLGGDLESRQINIDDDKTTPTGATAQIVEPEDILSRKDDGSTEQGIQEKHSQADGSMARRDMEIQEDDKLLPDGLEAFHDALSDLQSKIQDELVRMKRADSVEKGEGRATSPSQDEAPMPAWRKQWQKIKEDAENERQEQDDRVLHVVGRTEEFTKKSNIEEKSKTPTEPMKSELEREREQRDYESFFRRYKAEEEEKKAKRKAEEEERKAEIKDAEEELERLMRERLAAFGFLENQIQALVDGESRGEGEQEHPVNQAGKEAVTERERERILHKIERERIIHENERKNLLYENTANKQPEESNMQLDTREEMRQENEDQGYKEFLEKQKALEMEKRRAEEEELEKSMRRRLAEAGFWDKDFPAPIETERGASEMKSLAMAPQPTYAKIPTKHLDIETLHYYDIPYEYDTDPSYIIVLRELTQRETETLFEHTRRLRQRLAFQDSRSKLSRPGDDPVRTQPIHHVEATPPDGIDPLDKPSLRRRTRSQGNEPRPNLKTLFY